MTDGEKIFHGCKFTKQSSPKWYWVYGFKLPLGRLSIYTAATHYPHACPNDKAHRQTGAEDSTEAKDTL